jgi:hypothetical protein
MINPRRVWSHGKWIEVEDLDYLPKNKARAEKRARQRQQEFVKVPLQWATDAAKATGTRGAMVWILLLHMAWKGKSTTFPLSNALLAKYGIQRETKRRILARLEASGQIRIERRYKQSPVVTLLAV